MFFAITFLFFFQSAASSEAIVMMFPFIPYAICSALKTEHVRALRIGISLKMAE